MINDETLKSELIELFKSKYNCHTLILYGSIVHGDFNDSSDIDIMGFRKIGKDFHDGSYIGSHQLDAFIISEKEIPKDLYKLLQLRNGVVLFEKNKFGTKLLERIQKHYHQGPLILSENQKEFLIEWCIKMSKRIDSTDINGNFRRIWLLNDLLEIYFKLRDKWYLGPKDSFRYLKDLDIEVYKSFDSALKTLEIKDISKLIANVIGKTI